MAKERAATERVNLYLTTEAADLLTRLAPSENKRGAYVSALLTQAAHAAGLIDTANPLPTGGQRVAPVESDVLAQVARLADEVSRLVAVVSRQVAQQGGEGPAEA